MTMGSENLNNGSSTAPDRFPSNVNPFRQRRDGTMVNEGGMSELAARNGAAPTLEAGLDRAASLPGLDGLAEPVFSPGGWLDNGATIATMASMADHPLLRGLLLELPPRGTIPASGWLDRWFEAARSILELLYVQEAARTR